MSNNNPNLSSEIKPNLEKMGLVEISPSTVRKQLMDGGSFDIRCIKKPGFY